jgi:hypothetical protein
MNDTAPAGAPACSPTELRNRQLGFVLWYYRPDGITPHTRGERVDFLRQGIALRAEQLGELTQGTPEQIDDMLMQLWHGDFPAAKCDA